MSTKQEAARKRAERARKLGRPVGRPHGTTTAPRAAADSPPDAETVAQGYEAEAARLATQIANLRAEFEEHIADFERARRRALRAAKEFRKAGVRLDTLMDRVPAAKTSAPKTDGPRPIELVRAHLSTLKVGTRITAAEVATAVNASLKAVAIGFTALVRTDELSRRKDGAYEVRKVKAAA